jgi:hypothetical protein
LLPRVSRHLCPPSNAVCLSPQSKELPALSQQLAELSCKLGRGPASSVSEVDRLLAGQLGLLQQQLAGLAARLDAREAAELEGHGVATREELQVTMIFEMLQK